MLLSHHAEQHLCIFSGGAVGGGAPSPATGAPCGCLLWWDLSQGPSTLQPKPLTHGAILPPPPILNANVKVLMPAFSFVLKHLWMK